MYEMASIKIKCEDDSAFMKIVKEKGGKIRVNYIKNEFSFNTFYNQRIEEILVSISKECPNTPIIIEYSYIEDNFAVVECFQYENGESSRIGLRLDYKYDDFTAPIDISRESIETEVTRFFSKIDKIEILHDGYIADFNKDKILTLEYFIEEYKVKAVKEGCYINIKIFEKVIKDCDWIGIDDNEIPF